MITSSSVRSVAIRTPVTIRVPLVRDPVGSPHWLPDPGTPWATGATSAAVPGLDGSAWILVGGLVSLCVVCSGLAAGILLAVAEAKERVQLEVTVFDFDRPAPPSPASTIAPFDTLLFVSGHPRSIWSHTRRVEFRTSSLRVASGSFSGGGRRC